MIVTIDGPAAAGKSTVAQKLAARLQIPYLDSGATYRAIAYAAVQRGVDPADEASLVDLARSVELSIECGATGTQVWVDRQEVTDHLRTMEVSAATSVVARCQPVREILIERQRETGRKLGSFVADGRDQGAVVFPQANAKFVLEASARIRAERRVRERVEQGEVVDLDAVLGNIRLRDQVDAKQWAPLLVGDEAIVIDSTKLTSEEVVERMMKVLESP